MRPRSIALKTARPDGQDGTGPDSDGHGAENRGLRGGGRTDQNRLEWTRSVSV